MRLYIFSVGIIYQQQNSVHKHVDPAGGALEELQRIIGIIRAEWKETQIIVRSDSAYARKDIMKFCEEQACVDYVIAMASNSQMNYPAASRRGIRIKKE